MPLWLIRATYITVYILWALYLLVSYYIRLESRPIDPEFWPAIIIGVSAFFVSAWIIIRDAAGNDRQQSAQHTENDYRLTQRNLVYLTPFAFLILQSLAFVVPPFM